MCLMRHHVAQLDVRCRGRSTGRARDVATFPRVQARARRLRLTIACAPFFSRVRSCSRPPSCTAAVRRTGSPMAATQQSATRRAQPPSPRPARPARSPMARRVTTTRARATRVATAAGAGPAVLPISVGKASGLRFRVRAADRQSCVRRPRALSRRQKKAAPVHRSAVVARSSRATTTARTATAP